MKQGIASTQRTSESYKRRGDRYPKDVMIVPRKAFKTRNEPMDAGKDLDAIGRENVGDYVKCEMVKWVV